jgi:hypothetical protein
MQRLPGELRDGFRKNRGGVLDLEVGQSGAELLALAGAKYPGMTRQDLLDEGGAGTRLGLPKPLLACINAGEKVARMRSNTPSVRLSS